MREFTDINSLEKLSEEIILKNVNLIFLTLLDEVKLSLNLDPYYSNINVKIVKQKPSKIPYDDIFNIGVNRLIQNDILTIEVNEDYKRFVKFILLREIYNLFIPKELQKYDVVQIIINQIIITKLSKESNLNEWRALIRSKLKQYDSLTRGFSRLFSFDILEGFFKNSYKPIEKSYTPIQFFFFYLRTNKSLIRDDLKEFYDIFLNEFTNYISRSMINDEIIETIRCLIYIFYKVKRYRDLLSYRVYFQEFKENGEINTNLSLRKFTKNMNWLKKYSYIAPSYQLNWNAINVGVIALFLQFNPKLKKAPILKILGNLPFFSTLKSSISNFSLDLCGYVILPYNYLNDFINFIKKLKSFNIIINQYCLLRISQKHMINLNYFREYKQKKIIINPNYREYDKKYELEFQIDFGNKFYNQELSLLDFLIIDRIRHFSVGGLGFETRRETLNLMKSDLINEIISQQTILINLKKTLTIFHNSNNLKTEFSQIINKKLGFFYIKKQLEVCIYILGLFEDIINKNPTITHFSAFRDFIKKQYPSHLIEDNIKFKKISFITTGFKDLISLFFKSNEIYNNEVEKLRKFYDLINSCHNLKIFSFENIENIIADQNIIKTIFKRKEEKLKSNYEKYRVQDIKIEQINNIINKFLNNKPPIIIPLLINTIITKNFYKDFLQLILVDSKETLKVLDQIKMFFPRILIHRTKDLISNENYIYVEISTPKLNTKEKRLLYSIIHNNFKDGILYCKSYLWSGIVDALSSKNFYDFENYKYFYTKDLYEQYFLYVQSVLGESLEPINQNINKNQANFWSKSKDIMNLVKKVNTRAKSENYEFNMDSIDKLLNFSLDLNNNILNEDKFVKTKQEGFFSNYVKSIKFIPAFQRFGLTQYFIYLYPSDINEIDFKLLLTNTFQKIRFPASIDSSNSFIIKYIMPYGDPNKAYLNWLVKSKKVIREYCGFFIKKIHRLFQFNLNITSEGWNYSPDRFKAHMQNILFNKEYEFQIPDIKEFDLSDRKELSHFGPESPEYESLINIHNWRPLDIKSYLGTLKYYPTENFTDLIKKGLIFPYLTLKNLDFQDKLYIIIPDLKEELNKTLINIFSFFNYGFIYETEGEYFIHGFPEEAQFKNGLMIKLYLPDCELSEFIKVFDLIFEYLEIQDYLILNDLVDGKNLLKSVYGGLKFLDSYNPLKNLIWNENSKTWENHTLFTPKFEPIYPDLIEKGKKD